MEISAVKMLDKRTVHIALPELTADVASLAQTDKKTGKTHYKTLDPIYLGIDIEFDDGKEIYETVYATVNTLDSR